MRASLEHRFVGVIESSVWRRMDEIKTRALYVRPIECIDMDRFCQLMSTRELQYMPICIGSRLRHFYTSVEVQRDEFITEYEPRRNGCCVDQYD